MQRKENSGSFTITPSLLSVSVWHHAVIWLADRSGSGMERCWYQPNHLPASITPLRGVCVCVCVESPDSQIRQKWSVSGRYLSNKLHEIFSNIQPVDKQPVHKMNFTCMWRPYILGSVTLSLSVSAFEMNCNVFAVRQSCGDKWTFKVPEWLIQCQLTNNNA